MSLLELLISEKEAQKILVIHHSVGSHLVKIFSRKRLPKGKCVMNGIVEIVGYSYVKIVKTWRINLGRILINLMKKIY